jgi:hypothetical protein
VKADKEAAKMVVMKTTVGGADHYWLQSGAATYDGIEYVFDANCKEVCQMGGFRQKQPDCQKAYDKATWAVVWEED